MSHNPRKAWRYFVSSKRTIMLPLDQKLSQFRNLSATELEILYANFSKTRFRKGQILLSPGQNLRELYYIESGYVRGYFTLENEDETTWVKDGGSFLVPAGLFHQQRSGEYIEFLTDTEAYIFQIDLLTQPGSPVDTAYRNLLLHVFDEELILFQRREQVNHIRQAKHRYDLFQAEFPHLIGRVNNQVLASLLQMSLKHFARLKNAQ
jgi:CRP/FNR family transcriptional regulator, anaerobic regulatory protein